MSTVKAINFQHPSATAVNAATTSGGDLTNAAGVSFMSANKNLLYNGAMQVAQRGTSATGITTNTYNTADRWYTNIFSMGTWTQTVEDDAPTGSGLRKSLKMLCTTADASPAAGDLFLMQQLLEGQDVQRIAKGTASAQQLTLSFWVKSNVTGTFIAALYDPGNNRTVSATYSISASATWEKKTITFPADTTGAIANTNAAGLNVNFWLGAGSNFTSGTLNTTWATYANANVYVGGTNLAAATNNYWQVTGVQLEIGPVATSFEFKSFGQELRECQRYYQVIPVVSSLAAAYNTNALVGSAFVIPTMRATPTATYPAGTTVKTQNGTSYGTASDYSVVLESNNIIAWTCTSTRATNTVCMMYTDTGAAARLSAEL